MSKQDELLRLLKTGKPFTKKEIYHRLSLWNSGSAINRLRNRGFNIVTTMMERSDGQAYASYKLVAG